MKRIRNQKFKWAPLCAFAIFASLILSSCDPDEFAVELYAEDIEAARTGDSVLVPATISFGLLGDDKEGLLEKAKEIMKKYVAADSKIQISEATLGKKLTITTTIPLGVAAKVIGHAEHQQRPMFLELVDQDPTFSTHPMSVKLALNQDKLNEMNEELEKINFILKLGETPKSTIFNLTGSRSDTQLMIIGAFVDDEAVLKREATLKPRQRMVLSFGAADINKRSVWDHIAPQFFMK
jgi:hypothetical protein